MLVGFVIAATIAASVMFTIRANTGNRDNVDAFVAAESGRDQAYASIKDGCVAGDLASDATPTLIGGSEQSYTYSVQTTADAEPSDTRDLSTLDGLSAVCPSASTTRVVVEATGYGPDGSTATVTSVYPWNTILSHQPGGTMAFFDGKFKTTGSGYTGDLVVRTGNYDCSNAATIVGDLWVVGGEDGTDGGNVTLSSNCVVTGSIYAAGTVLKSSQPVTIGGDVIARGEISLNSDGMTIGGDVYSGSVVNVSATGSGTATIGGDIISAGDVNGIEDAADPADKWEIQGVILENQPDPTFDPTLPAVFGMTTWVDLGTGTEWGDAVVNTSCPTDISGLLDDSAERLIVDYTGCGGPSKKVNITVKDSTLTRDVLLYVPAGYQMNVSIEGDIASTPTPAPQLWLVHADSVIGDSEPALSCANKDNFGTKEKGSTKLSIDARILVYTACGLTGTIGSDFSGQIYVNADTRTVNAEFTCAEMSWEPALPQLSCRIRGEGGAEGETIVTYDIGNLIFQTEN
jgi:hypothetical protein